MADAGEDGEADAMRKRRRGMLKLFYGASEANNAEEKRDPCDINSAHFQSQAYLSRLFQEKSLPELMDKEAEIVKQIRSLDSDMQTLVYENYNKFISATDTIKKMKSDFRRMEDEMNKLEITLSSVTQFSDKVSSALQEKREGISKLSGVHTLLQKLQFLFELPSRLKKCMEMKQYSLAVRYYIKARDVLHQYKHMASFQGIHSDCEAIVKELMQILRELLRNPTSSTRQLAECVDLLLKLHEPAGALCEEFLTLARDKVDKSISVLRHQAELKEKQAELTEDEKGNEKSEGEREPKTAPDILEFMDTGCNGFLSDITLLIASYNELFLTRQSEDIEEQHKIHQVAKEKIEGFVLENMADYFKLVRRRLEFENQTEDSTLLVHALDKFHRKAQTVHQLLPDSSLGRTSANIVAYSAHSRVSQYAQYLEEQLDGIITDMRQSLVSSRFVGNDKSQTLADVLTIGTSHIIDRVKAVLLNLKAFINPDIPFSTKPYFRGPFCIDDVREGLVVTFLKTLRTKAQLFCDTDSGSSPSSTTSSTPPALVLLMSRLCYDFAEKTTGHLFSILEDWFPVDEEIKMGCVVTQAQSLIDGFKSSAQDLINYYVKMQGVTLSQMIRKSVETRDWLNTIEPRTVRAVMKRIVEDVTAMDTQVGYLFEEGVRKAHSSDSSKWTHNYSITRGGGTRGQFGYNTSSNIDTGLLSNIQKLFSERIEIFTAVEFNKVSVLTGVIKIALKTLLECVRLRTFSKFGLQQIQVDTHYLQLYLWRFVSDENLVYFLLEEVVSSTIHRCTDPELMESSVVDIIGERS